MDENSTEQEDYPLDPDVGMAPEPEAVEETVTGDVDPAGELGTEGLGEDEDGNPITQAEGRPAPLEAWSDEDPEFVDLLSLEEAETQEDAPDEDLPVEAPEESEEDEDTPVTDQGVARWVQYELWGRNVSLGEGWTRYAVADFAGGIEAEVDDLTAGTNLQLRIRLVDNLGRFSKWSAAIQVSLPSDFTPPPEPTAPMVSDNNGIIVTRWDGQLMGETPADMSHVLHYVQQMHPAGNPDGPEGDPQLISEFRRAGRHTSGNFADRVEHRAWLSAVDTTGNESPRSEYAYFTPSAPVDAQRIQDELETLDGRVGEGFAESLTEAIAGADQRIDSLAVGELFVENAIKAPSIDVQDLAANAARMNELWVGFAGIAEAQIDSLLGNSAKFKVIEGASITGGSLRTSSANGHGVTIDEGSISYYDIFSGNTRSHVAPYVEFGTGQVEGERPKIAAGPGGTGLVLSAGNDLNGQGASLNPIVMHGQVLTDRVTLGDGARFTKNSLMIANSSDIQLSGIVTDGPRTGLLGRMPANPNPQAMFVTGQVGPYAVSSQQARGSITYNSPVPHGSRFPQITVEGNQGGFDNWRGFTGTVFASTSSRFLWTIDRTQSASGVTTTYWINYIANWM